MIADTLLSRLSKVKKTGPDRWSALCPAHDDHHPSLGVRELDNGRVVVRCRSVGCSVEEILATVGLGFSDLFPPRIDGHFAKGERRPFFPSDVFTIVQREVIVLAVIACDMHSAKQISAADHARLLLAAERLSEIARAAYGK